MNSTYEGILDFIKKVYPDENPVPLHAPRFLGKEKEYLSQCIDSTYVSYVGQFVVDFEEHIKRLTGAAHAVAMVNGTAALQMALMGVGVRPGDEVITQALTFAATSAAIQHAGADPIFIDVEKSTLGMSPEALSAFLSKHTYSKNGQLINKKSGKTIKAVVPVHIFGHPVRIEEIETICGEYNLTLVEDAAESLGSLYRGKHTGIFGKVGILSFNGNKPVTTGGGGMVITNDQALAERIRFISTTAKKKHPWEFLHEEVGYNYRLPNVNAALGCAQMEYFDTILENKRSTAEIYRKYFESMNIPFFTEPANCRSNYWLNAIMMPNREERECFLEYTNTHGVQTRPVWKLIPTLPPYLRFQCEPIPVAQELEDRIVNIPSSYRK